MTSQFAYHDYLYSIAKEDIEYIRKKDQQYNASWKRRGGRGAFFTIVRPWDRIENMVAITGHDIFAIMQNEDFSLSDGTVIAAVRDLRRYLMLLEAEMLQQRADIAKEKIVEDVGRIVPRYNGPGYAEEYHPPGTPEDGGHHARYRQIDSPGAIEELATQRQEFKDEQPKVRWDLYDGADEAERKEQEDKDCLLSVPLYTQVNGYNLINRTQLPEHYWQHLPRMPMEQNHKEWTTLPIHYQGLYTWVPGENKYRMGEVFHERWMK